MIVAGSASPLLLSSAGGYNLTNSLRFRSSASAYLNRTFTQSGDTQKFTQSVWCKRGTLGAYQTIGYTFFTGTYNGQMRFNSNDTLDIYVYYDGSSYTGQLSTTQVFRDPSAWYHFVLAVDTTQATASNRIKFYINGVQVTAFGTANYPNQNQALVWNASGNTGYFINAQQGNQNFFDGYLAELNYIDGQALTPSSFGETSTSTGVWIPKKYTGTYGTNGFYLPFTNTASTSTLGNDFSGNSNTWTVNNISLTAGTTYDSMTDVPTLTSATTANYCTWNPLDQLDGSLANGNLSSTTGTSGGSNCRGTFAMSSGKWYFECTPTTNGGIASIGISIFPGSDAKQGSIYVYQADDGNKYSPSGGSQSFGSTYTTNDVIGVAVDMTAGYIWWAKNGTWQASGDPTTGANPALTGLTGNAFTYLTDRNVGATCTVALNTGQQPFAYTPPTGFNRLNTFNLPTPTIGATASTTANKYFDISLWTGNGSTQSITNSGSFQPDWVWIKSRSPSGYQHVLQDVIRGTGQTKKLYSSLDEAENGANAPFGHLSSFDSNGFSVSIGSTNANQTNASSQTYVGWQWKANGAGSTNTAGSITSTVSANTSAGFSIVTYTGTGSAATIGHGLGVAPSMVIVKSRSTTGNWNVYHANQSATPQNGILYLNLSDAFFTLATWNNTAPTSSVFSINGSGYGVNNSSVTYVAYCFAPVAGYSAFGSYTGNGSTDGAFIFTGFRPKYIMMKSTSTESWELFDTSRSSFNQAVALLEADASGSENTSSTSAIDILSNGFKQRNTRAATNGSGTTYIYMAFAENPFKYSNAR